jgi:hypothetical protein
MSKAKLSSHERQPLSHNREPSSQKFLGLSLAGGKTDKACLALIDYYPKENKVFLSKLFHSIQAEENISSDLKISDLLIGFSQSVETLAVDQPWTLPQCMLCKLKCPGFEVCQEPHIQWFWNKQKLDRKKKKSVKIFTPYTQRCVESVISSELEQSFEVSHALGANSAPLLARAHFLKKRSPDLDWIEVFPPLSVWRLGKHLKIKKSDLRSYRKSAVGEACRKQILASLQDHDVVFLYKEDIQIMVHSVHAFDAFICAYTAYLKEKNQTEKRPDQFPKNEDWIEFPKVEIKIR